MLPLAFQSVLNLSVVNLLSTCVLQLVKQCQAMVEASRVYCQTSKSFVNGLRELGHHCSGDAMMEVGGFLLSAKAEQAVKQPLKAR